MAVLDAPATRACVVVLGSGRCGSSVLMQVLGTLGVRLSESLIDAGRENPTGFFEDADIVRAHVALLKALGAWPYHPPPPDWETHPATATTAETLRALLRARMAGPGQWGFKDPRAATFLPLWRRLFAEQAIEPRYVLALREPGAIIESFMRAYGATAPEAERIWLTRTREALRWTEGRCHLVHYEDWFRQPRATAEALADFVGLPRQGIPAALALLRPELDHAGRQPHVFHAPEAAALHASLRDRRGLIGEDVVASLR